MKKSLYNPFRSLLSGFSTQRQRLANAIALNKKTHGQYAVTTLLQHNLWKAGDFSNVKGRHGSNIDYGAAVDGKMGPMTRAAIANANAMGYVVDLKSGTLYKSGLPAIIEHKTKNQVAKPYIVVDKRQGVMSIYKGDQLLESHRVTLGKRQGDALIPTDEDVKWYKQLPGMTGAGIFTLDPRPKSPYVGNEPMYILRNGKPGGHFSQAIHSPANSTDRMAPFKDNHISNRVSSGCISPNAGVLRHIFDTKVIQKGDSVYILPELQGNALIEKDGMLQMLWGENNPSTYVDGNGKKRYLRYNTNR